MRKLYIFGLITLACVIIGLAWAEQMTFTTYYPAPYGVYREFTTTSKTSLATNPLGTSIGQDPESMVGIGRSIPRSKLHVSNGNIILDAEGFDPYISLNSDGLSDATQARIKALDEVGFAITNDANDVHMVITSIGNVGIGTTTPETTSPANSESTGNLDANDVYLRSFPPAGLWMSQLMAPTWTPIDKPNLPLPGWILPYTTGTTNSWAIPGVVDASAKEILVYVHISTELSDSATTFFRIYTQDGSVQYTFYLFARSFPTMRMMNSETFWLPITSERILYVRTTGQGVNGSAPTSQVAIVGYR